MTYTETAAAVAALTPDERARLALLLGVLQAADDAQVQVDRATSNRDDALARAEALRAAS